jgi:hypothetical protein
MAGKIGSRVQVGTHKATIRFFGAVEDTGAMIVCRRLTLD